MYKDNLYNNYPQVYVFCAQYFFPQIEASIWSDAPWVWQTSRGANLLENICSLFSSASVSLSFSLLKNIFTGHKLLRWQFGIFNTLTIPFCCLLASTFHKRSTHFFNCYSPSCIMYFLVGGFKDFPFIFGFQHFHL